jgi:hypothetical protein
MPVAQVHIGAPAMMPGRCYTQRREVKAGVGFFHNVSPKRQIMSSFCHEGPVKE